jgi:hypothetical protein
VSCVAVYHILVPPECITCRPLTTAQPQPQPRRARQTATRQDFSAAELDAMLADAPSASASLPASESEWPSVVDMACSAGM